MIKLNAAQLRVANSKLKTQISKLRKNDIYIILDDVLDTYNVGGVFRLADAVGAKKVYLCGRTETPPNPRIKKASINTTEVVDWEYSASVTEAISKLKCQMSKPSQTWSKLQVVAVEQSNKSIPYNKYEYKFPLAVVVGNESYGVSKEVLEMADAIVEIPMFGINISLNVIVSLGIVLFKALEKLR